MTVSTGRKGSSLTRIPVTRNIKVLLAYHRIGLLELSKSTRVSYGLLKTIVSGKTRVPADNKTVHKVAEYFGQPIDALFPLVDLEDIATSVSAPLIGVTIGDLPAKSQDFSSRNSDDSPKKAVRG